MFRSVHEGDLDDWQAFLDFCEAWLSTTGQGNFDASFDHDSSGKIDIRDFAYFASVWDTPSFEETDFYYLHDALGSVRGLIGGRYNRESDREFYNYDVYGSPSNAIEPSAAGNPVRFAGYRYDAETGLYDLRNRAYDPLYGRFLQHDPIGYADSMNLYEYVLSNPANYVDPWGLMALEDDLTPGQLKDLLTNPEGKDLEKMCDDQVLCYVTDLLKFREGRITLFMYLFDGGVPRLEREAMGMTGVNVANSGLNEAFVRNGQIYLGDPFLTVGDVRQPFKNKCYMNQCKRRMKELVREVVTTAILQIEGGIALKGAGLLLKVAQQARGPMVWGGSRCMDEFVGTAANYADDLAKDATQFFGQASNAGRTNAQLVQEIGTRAEAWGVREGLGKGPVAGTYKHGYADKLLTRYQNMFGDRGLSTESRFINGAPWERGVDPLRGSIRLDVVEGSLNNPSWVWDYKFGSSQLTPARINQIRTGAGLGPNIPITEVKP